jgi:hypothetical protein
MPLSGRTIGNTAIGQASTEEHNHCAENRVLRDEFGRRGLVGLEGVLIMGGRSQCKSDHRGQLPMMQKLPHLPHLDEFRFFLARNSYPGILLGIEPATAAMDTIVLKRWPIRDGLAANCRSQSHGVSHCHQSQNN